MDFSQFHRLFQSPVIKVELNWERLLHIDPPVSLRAIAEPAEVRGLRTTWYVDAIRSVEISHRETSHKPLTLGEAARRRAALTPERRARLQRMAHLLGAEPTPLAVPCYALPEDELLLLDGNHRLTSLLADRRPMRLLAVVVHGPIDSEILPDLDPWV